MLFFRKSGNWKEVEGTLKNVILALIELNGARSYSEIAKKINRDRRSAKFHMDKLLSLGILKREGEKYVIDKDKILISRETAELREVAFFLSVGFISALSVSLYLYKPDIILGALLVYSSPLLYYLYKFFTSKENIKVFIKYEEPTNI